MIALLATTYIIFGILVGATVWRTRHRLEPASRPHLPVIAVWAGLFWPSALFIAIAYATKPGRAVIERLLDPPTRKD